MPPMRHIAMFVQLRLKSVRKGVIPLPPFMSFQCVTLVFYLDSSIKSWNDMAECHPSSSLLSSQCVTLVLFHLDSSASFVVIPVRDTGIQEKKKSGCRQC
ncbi:MAG: hypothetical protein ACR5LA_07540 [Wolbachia sp.]